MSISLSLDFQNNLYKAMDTDFSLKSLVKNIYQSIPSNPKYPYIWQHVNNIKLLNVMINTYEVNGEINIYIRDSNFGNFKNIINGIERIFSESQNISTYNYICGKLSNGEFAPSQDLMTMRLKLRYEVLIQERLI